MLWIYTRAALAEQELTQGPDMTLVSYVYDASS
jgi:hypothetical protein